MQLILMITLSVQYWYELSQLFQKLPTVTLNGPKISRSTLTANILLVLMPVFFFFFFCHLRPVGGLDSQFPGHVLQCLEMLFFVTQVPHSSHWILALVPANRPVIMVLVTSGAVGCSPRQVLRCLAMLLNDRDL